MTLTYLKERLNKSCAFINSISDEKLSFIQIANITLDLLISIPIYGINITDYFLYRFYNKRHFEKLKFMSFRKRKLVMGVCNNKNEVNKFRDKATFNKIFNDFIKREWIDIDTCAYEDFVIFTEKHKFFIVKPKTGGDGKSIYKDGLKNIANLNDYYHKLKGKGIILEEIVLQNREIAKFNPSSVNTVRVVTVLTTDNIPIIMTANFRMGNGTGIADNFHQKGVVAAVDIETGVVKSIGADIEGKTYLFHPFSGQQIVGFKIPYWEEVCKTVHDAALVVPEVRYVGWDVVIGCDGIISIIEGNDTANPDISQAADQEGKWPLYKPYIKIIKELNKKQG
ncbi:MAG: hypothetical protein M0Q02_13770 [Candidatus Muirbacterium halophilum]|nr:hypothetical protein [Candidatus Muirbacterium halophilum]